MPRSILPLINKSVTKSLKGRLACGVLTRSVATTVNDFGDPSITEKQTFPFEGLRSDFSALYRAQAGIPDTDVQILILAGTLKTTPQKDDVLELGGRRYRTRKIITVDPAGATFTLQAFCLEPTFGPGAPY